MKPKVPAWCILILLFGSIGLAQFQIPGTQAAPRSALEQHPGSVTLTQTQAINPDVYYRIVARHSGKVVDVSGGSYDNGAVVHQWNYVGIDNQKWRFIAAASGYYKIVAKHSGKVLDVSGGSYDNGAVIHQWDYFGIPNQQWKITAVAGGYYKITARHSGKVLDVGNESNDNGAVILQWDYVGTSNQHWRLVPVETIP